MSRYADALADSNMAAFLHMIRVGEGTADPDGYRRHFGGRLFDSYADHPRIAITAGLGRNKYTSTAAGAYQFLSRTWDDCIKAMARIGTPLPDFSPASQDLAAVFLIDRRRALEDVLAGRFDQAVAKCAREWASLPGSPYGQPVKTMAQARAVYEQCGGAYQAVDNAPALAAAPATAPTPTAPAPPATEPPMPLPAIAAALLPSLIESIPKLGALFGSGSKVAERNVAAAELALKIAAEATGARNTQEAVESIKADPQLLQAATQAIESRWFELSEAGGGGIEGARKADAAFRATGGTVWQSPSFWFLLLAMPLVWAVVGSVVGLWGIAWPEDVRAAIATAVVSLVVGGASGYYWGQTTSRNRTPAP